MRQVFHRSLALGRCNRVRCHLLQNNRVGLQCPLQYRRFHLNLASPSLHLRDHQVYLLFQRYCHRRRLLPPIQHNQVIFLPSHFTQVHRRLHPRSHQVHHRRHR